jgi:hypothetical protein
VDRDDRASEKVIVEKLAAEISATEGRLEILVNAGTTRVIPRPDLRALDRTSILCGARLARWPVSGRLAISRSAGPASLPKATTTFAPGLPPRRRTVAAFRALLPPGDERHSSAKHAHAG